MADRISAEPDESFIERQIEFAAHLRDPQNQPAPADVEDRRMQIYRDLFFNNISGFLAKSFSVLRSCMDDDAWQELMRDFYRDHSSRTPLFTRLAGEFVKYVSEEREPQDGDPPFLSELAHYEWVEVELALSPDPVPDATIDQDGDLLQNCPALSSLSRAMAYRFPVNEIGAQNQPGEPAPEPVYFLVHRNADNKVRFIKLNAVSARLYALIDTHPAITGRAALEQIGDEMQHPNPDAVIEGGHAILRKWREIGVVLGTRSP